MALINKLGYGQVEPNHLSAQRTGQIYAQLPCSAAIETLENGMFVHYDYAAGECKLVGEGEPMLVFNEVKLYDVKHSYKDFALKKADFTEGVITPRVFKTNVGDIFTTNTFAQGTTVVVGDKLQVGLTGMLEVAAAPVAGKPVFIVAKEYTLADGQPAVKVQRIA